VAEFAPGLRGGCVSCNTATANCGGLRPSVIMEPETRHNNYEYGQSAVANGRVIGVRALHLTGVACEG
jgi:hypothetical protein